MKLIPKRTPEAIKVLFPTLVWNVPTQEKHIYLSFDDGPTTGITSWVLDTLNYFNAKATFFCIGKNIKDNPQTFRRIVQEGHGIGNHTYDHLKGWETSTTKYLENVDLGQEAIIKEDANTSLFRPPYGKIKRKQIKSLQKAGYKIVMWNVLPVDWDKNITPETCLQNVLNNTKEGSIVVFHDSIKASRNMQYALPKVLQYFTEKGFLFKRIPE